MKTLHEAAAKAVETARRSKTVDKSKWVNDLEVRAVFENYDEAQQVAVPVGYALAMAVLQSSLYQFLDDVERSECDALIAAAQGVKQ